MPTVDMEVIGRYTSKRPQDMVGIFENTDIILFGPQICICGFFSQFQIKYHIRQSFFREESPWQVQL